MAGLLLACLLQLELEQEAALFVDGFEAATFR